MQVLINNSGWGLYISITIRDFISLRIRSQGLFVTVLASDTSKLALQSLALRTGVGNRNCDIVGGDRHEPSPPPLGKDRAFAWDAILSQETAECKCGL